MTEGQQLTRVTVQTQRSEQIQMLRSAQIAQPPRKIQISKTTQFLHIMFN